jgi:hypothetical protein
MLQDAVNQLSRIIKIYPNIYKVSIHDTDQITIYYYYKIVNNEDTTARTTIYKEKTFTNTNDLMPWCEQNLKMVTFNWMKKIFQNSILFFGPKKID